MSFEFTTRITNLSVGLLLSLGLLRKQSSCGTANNHVYFKS